MAADEQRGAINVYFHKTHRADSQMRMDDLALHDDFSEQWLLKITNHTLYADSEIRMDDLALHDDFSEQNRSWDDSGTIISDTWGTYQNVMGPRMQYLLNSPNG